MAQPHRTVIQERRHLIRAGLAELLAVDARVEVVGSAVRDTDLVAACREHQPDVVVLELVAPWSTAELLCELAEVVPGLRVVALHRGRGADHERAAREAGVHALAAYGAGISSILSGVLGLPVLAWTADDRRLPKGRAMLTPRELEVLRHLADGCTAAECAAALHVSRKTVDNHKQRIFAKLLVQNQAHAVSLAHRMGLLGRAPTRTAASL